MLHHDKVVLMRSSDGEDVNSGDEAFFSLQQVFGPFSCWTGKSKRWKFQLLLKGHKARREQQCNKKDEEAHRDRLGAVSS